MCTMCRWLRKRRIISAGKSMLNVKPRTIFCRDNLDILEGINTACIDLIYLDPPFNKNKTFTSPIGSSAKGAGFKDIFREEDVKDEWVKSIEFESPKLHQYLFSVKQFSSNMNYCYLVYMAIRLIECRRILKESGSLYLHCDHTMSHYLKIVLDTIFGESHFKNEIVWQRTRGSKSSSVRYGRTHDTILFYAKTRAVKWSNPRMALPPGAIPKAYKRDQNGRLYRTIDIVAEPSLGGNSPMYEYKGFTPKTRWRMTKDKLEKLDKQGLLVFSKTGRPYRKQYLDDHPGTPLTAWWGDIPGAGHMPKEERTGYATQKPLALMERIIEASSDKGDVVLDPFCGCATTCVAAEKLGRNWIGIDVGIGAYELVQERLENAGLTKLFDDKPHFSTEPPVPTDTTDRESGYIYIISNPAFSGMFKVGIARDVKQRLNSYQTSDPDRAYKLEYSLKTTKYREIEKQIHAEFENRHEWVHAKKADIIAAIESAH